MEIASKVVEREISEKDHKDLIDEFIKMWVKHHDRDCKDVRRKLYDLAAEEGWRPHSG